jgi:hypothetical protein
MVVLGGCTHHWRCNRHRIELGGRKSFGGRDMGSDPWVRCTCCPLDEAEPGRGWPLRGGVTLGGGSNGCVGGGRHIGGRSEGMMSKLSTRSGGAWGHLYSACPLTWNCLSVRHCGQNVPNKGHTSAWANLGHVPEPYSPTVGASNRYSDSPLRFCVPSRCSESGIQLGVPSRCSKSAYRVGAPSLSSEPILRVGPPSSCSEWALRVDAPASTAPSRCSDLTVRRAPLRVCAPRQRSGANYFHFGAISTPQSRVTSRGFILAVSHRSLE